MSDLRQAIEDADDNYAAGQRHGQLAERERILRIIRSDPGVVFRSPHATDYLPQFLDRAALEAAVVGGQHTTEQQEER